MITQKQATAELLTAVKQDLRITHSALDTDIAATISACGMDLCVCGISRAKDSSHLYTDPLLLNAVKLYCRAFYTDDVEKGAAYMRRYEAMKSCLMMAEGYRGDY